MRKRLVYGTIRKTDGSLWNSLPISFRRTPLSYIPSSTFPIDTISVRTDSISQSEISNQGNLLGNFRTYLWCNQDGDVPSTYELCIKNTTKFRFSLPYGDGTPIDVNVLISLGGNTNDPQNQTIIEYIDERIDDVSVNNTRLFSTTFTALSNFSAVKIVNLTKGVYASSDNISHINDVMGISLNSISMGDEFRVMIKGEITDNSFNFIGNVPIFLGTDGELIQTISTTTSFVKQIGSVISSTSIYIEFKDSINVS